LQNQAKQRDGRESEENLEVSERFVEESAERDDRYR
jgi:hypothetical protein